MGRSMQPLWRRRILCLRDCSKAFARARKRPETQPAALVHRVPATLDPTNVGLCVVDVVRNEIVHRHHLHMPEIGRTCMIYGDAGRIRNRPGSAYREYMSWKTAAVRTPLGYEFGGSERVGAMPIALAVTFKGLSRLPGNIRRRLDGLIAWLRLFAQLTPGSFPKRTNTSVRRRFC